MSEAVSEAGVLAPAVPVEEVLVPNSSTSLLEPFDEGAGVVERFGVDCGGVPVALFWGAGLGDARLEAAIWRVSSSSCTAISFNSLSISLLTCVCAGSFERVFEPEAGPEAVVADFELDASESRERLLPLHSTLEERYMAPFAVIIRYILVPS